MTIWPQWASVNCGKAHAGWCFFLVLDLIGVEMTVGMSKRRVNHLKVMVCESRIACFEESLSWVRVLQVAFKNGVTALCC